MLDYINAIEKMTNQFGELKKATGMGEISTYKLEELIERTIDECKLQINKWNNIDGYEAMAETYTKFRRVLEEGSLLIKEIKQKQDIINPLISVKNAIIECGKPLTEEMFKVVNTQTENAINDLIDKVLSVEKEYIAGNLSIEKANKHIQKIKNTFKQYNVKTGDKTYDSIINCLNCAISESEKAYFTETKIEVSENCKIAEFLDVKSSETIQDLTKDVIHLTMGMSELIDELPRANIQTSINLDTIYNKIIEISDSSTSGRRITNIEMENLIPSLDYEIELMRIQVNKASISTTNFHELSHLVVAFAEKLKDKSKKSIIDIVTNENVKRVDKISTQLDVLNDLIQVSNIDLTHINTAMVIQSNRTLDNNPELQPKTDANYEKGRQIHLSLTKTI